MSPSTLLLIAALAFPASAQEDAQFGDALRGIADQARETNRVRRDGERMRDAGRGGAPLDYATARAVLRPLVESIGRGRAALDRMQAQDGSWGMDINPTGDTDIYGRVAVTSLALEAGAGNAGRAEGFIAGNVLREPAQVGRAGDRHDWPSYRAYALAYGSRTAMRRPELKAPDGRLLSEAVSAKIAELARSPNGFRYSAHGSSPASFQLALVLDALVAGRGPAEAVTSLADQLAAQRSGGSFGYSGQNAGGDGGMARAVLCETALRRAGRSDQRAVEAALSRYAENFRQFRDFMKSNDGRPHSGPNQWSDYYDLFSLYWVSAALADMRDLAPDRKAAYKDFAQGLAEHLMGSQRADGTWHDSRYGGAAYGTASAVVTLERLRGFILSQ